ncbi:diaminopimelate decarboxylase [Tamilnaduibacter salinus]|uniref:Diaminopimelate decarboxylase n=1 Tax=Tamilnaduibacter salinus TaxID=1484056 RepID=A0A2U1CXF1_9GAMM|nr:diaminopimelate decarboxylase [Tamilnaduibacter salinus]PVY76931.1 diaminopimelate decarboxylase [Tamilnaduibacter salinus]
MEPFNYRDGVLYAEEVPVPDIVREHGTPAYIYSRAALTTRYRAYDDALSDFPHLVCYAVKANSNIGVLSALARLGAGFDIVSVGELERVLRAGGEPSRVVFSGVGKQAHEMRRALSVGVRCFNVESEAELVLLNDVAGELGTQAPVSIRVNPDVDAGTHPYISTGLRENKFGIAIDDARRVYREAAAMPHLRLDGVDCHIGSQLTSLAPFMDTLDRVLLLVDQLEEDGISLCHIDMGGGLGVVYDQETPPDAGDYMAALRERLGDRALELILEPGRSIAANAGILVTRVDFLKSTEARDFAIIDAAMNDMLRPALYDAWQAIDPVALRDDVEEKDWDLVGPVCETGDFLGKQRRLRLKAGDLLAVRSAGAYGFVMSSNYNSRNRPPEVLVDGDRVHLVRRRETLEDQMGPECVLPE